MADEKENQNSTKPQQPENKDNGSKGKGENLVQDEKQQSAEGANPNPEKEIADLKDRLLRLAAEFDNYKKKVAKDSELLKNLGKAELASKLLPSLDEFELALNAFDDNKFDSRNAKGVELVFSNITDALKSAGLKEIEAKGKYDPYKHEIVLTKNSKEQEGNIIEVIRKGYTFNDIMLRPASVIVSNGKSEEK